VYSLMVDRIEREALTDRQAVIVAAAVSGKALDDFPTIDKYRAHLDEWLQSPLGGAGSEVPDHDRLMTMLGVA
jgi:hypothetical protein